MHLPRCGQSESAMTVADAHFRSVLLLRTLSRSCGSSIFSDLTIADWSESFVAANLRLVEIFISNTSIYCMLHSMTRIPLPLDIETRRDSMMQSAQTMTSFIGHS